MARRLEKPSQRGQQADDETRLGYLADEIDEPSQSLEMVISDTGTTEQIGNYRVTGKLGKGGMGTVYEVTDEASREIFALKTIETRFLKLPQNNAGRRFSHEIRVLNRLNHPGIVRLYDYGFALHPMGYEVAFFVMEKLFGRTINQEIKRGRRFSTEESLRMLRDISGALEYLEQNEVLHRDIKPANIVVEPDGRSVLMDFGLARSEEFTHLTRAGQIIGTLRYMAPERLAGLAIDSAADTYALGVVLFEMLTGTNPFAQDSPTSLIGAIQKGLTWPEHFAFDDIEPEVRRLVESMLAFDKKKRPSPRKLFEQCGSLVKRRVAGELSAPPLSETHGQTIADAPPFHDTNTLAPVAAGRADTIAERSKDSSQTSPSKIRAHLESGSRAYRLEGLRGEGPTWFSSIALMAGTAAIGLFVGIIWGRKSGGETIIRQVEKAPIEEIAGDTSERKRGDLKKDARRRPELLTASEALNFGNVMLRQGRYEDAVFAFDVALKYNFVLAEAYLKLGDAHWSLGHRKASCKRYKGYLALRPKAPERSRVMAKISAIGQECGD